MPSTFPDTLDLFATNLVNSTASQDTHPAHHNDLADAVNKIERNVPRVKLLAADAAAVVGTAYGNAGFSFPVEANTVRRFQICLRWGTNATTTGARFALSGPTLTAVAYVVIWNSTATAATTAVGAAYDVAHTVGTAANSGNSNVAVLEGHILCSVAGDVQVRSAAEVASPGSVTLAAGSSILYW